VLINQSAISYTGFSRKQLLGNSLLRLFPGIENTDIFLMFQRVMELRQQDFIETSFTFPDGRTGWYEINVYPVPEGIFCISKDITERKNAAEALNRSREEYRQLVEHSRDIIIRFNSKAVPVYVSPAVTEILGYSESEAVGMNLRDVIFEEDIRDVYDVFFSNIQAKKKTTVRQIRVRHKSGYPVWLEMRGTYLYYDDGSFDCLLATMRDITESKNAEEQIHRLLEEKELLIREIHHRVKNDLGMINALLNIQAEQHSDEKVKQSLTAAGNRVGVIQRVYDRLYQRDSSKEIDLQSLGVSLIEELRRGTIPPSCSVTYQLEKIILSPRTAISIGIILNELITNSVKYAFPEKESGEIEISANQPEPGLLRLVYRDNGTGLPADVMEKKESGFGLMMIDAITKQYSGMFTIEDGAGAVFSIELRI
jgi:hypothetical protein